MARLDEIAEGISTVLVSSSKPEPLNINLIGQGRAEATFLIRAIIDSCERQGVPLAHVRVGTDIGSDLIKQCGGQFAVYQSVAIEGSPLLGSNIELYRFAPLPS